MLYYLLADIFSPYNFEQFFKAKRTTWTSSAAAAAAASEASITVTLITLPVGWARTSRVTVISLIGVKN